MRIRIQASPLTRRGLIPLLDTLDLTLTDDPAELCLLELTDELPALSEPLVLVLADRPPRAEELAQVRGWLPRDLEDEALKAALYAVMHGLTVGTPQAPGPNGTGLTPRELELLRLVAAGQPNKAIAQRLGISDHTVKFHLNSIFNKLNASSRTEAVTEGIRRGLLLL